MVLIFKSLVSSFVGYIRVRDLSSRHILSTQHARILTISFLKRKFSVHLPFDHNSSILLTYL